MYGLFRFHESVSAITLPTPAGIPLPWGWPPNVYLLHGPRPALVDTGFGGSHHALCAAIREAGEDPEQIATILLTSQRPEAVGAVDAFPRARVLGIVPEGALPWPQRVEALRVSLTNLLNELLSGEGVPECWGRWEADRFVEAWVGGLPGRLDVETVHQGEPIEIDGWLFDVVATPGTDAAAACWMDARHGFLFGGSTLDIRPEPLVEDPAGREESLRSISRFTPSAILPAHGGIERSFRQAFRSLGLHAGSALAQLPWAFEGQTSAVQLAYNDIGGYPRSVVRFAAHVLKYRAMLDALVEAGVLVRESPDTVWSPVSASDPSQSRSFRGVLRAR